MKRIRKYNTNILFVLALIAIIFTGCNEESSIGLELLPSGDLITVGNDVFKDDISAYTFSENNIRTDEPSKILLGSFNDPLFGSTNASFAAQFRLIEIPGFGENPEVDSVKLFIYYRLIYGDTITSQKLKVYELESGLDVDAEYKQDVDLKSMASTQLIGEVDYLPKVQLDSASSDTMYQLIVINIDNSLGEKLMAADSSIMFNNDDFIEYFKGLLIEAEPVDGIGGTLLSLEAEYSGSYLGSAITLYYSNDSTRNYTNKTGRDTSYVTPYLISPFSARVSSITHNYSASPFYANLDSENIEDSLIYIQASGGLKSKILIDGLTSWADSVNTAINKAELIFQVDTIASQINLFAPPSRLLLTYIDTADVERLPSDYSFSSSYFGGVLNTDDYTYRFNITQHLQNIIEGTENRGFFLTTGQLADRANRVVLKGSTSVTGIKLIITYSKFNI